MKWNGKALLILLLAISAVDSARADLNAKPTATFAITVDNGAKVTEGVLLLCDKDDCSDAKPLEELGPQSFFCQDLECRALAYGFARYLQLQLILSDGRNLTSQIFALQAFDAELVATVTGDELRVEEKPAGQSGMLDRRADPDTPAG